MKLKDILITGICALALTACHDDNEVVEQITGPTEVNLVSCTIDADNTKATGTKAWKSRRAAVLEMVAQQNPDVFCSQGQLWNQVIYLRQQLPAFTSVDYNVDGNDASTGLHNTVMFRTDKYTLVDKGRFWLSQKPTTMSYPWASKDEARRCVTWVILKDNSTHAPFMVMSTFVNDGDQPEDNEARLNSASLIIDKIEELAADYTGLPVILAANLNASADKTDARRLSLEPYFEALVDARTHAPVTDTKPSCNGYGNVDNLPRLTTDYIMMENATPLSFATVEAVYGSVYLSNHNPISSKIKF